MCTVTFIPSGNEKMITSSRDEQDSRPAALSPEVYKIKDRLMLYPKDPKGGGSWIVVNDLGHIAVLLNGGYKPHIPRPPYKKSRGSVLIEIISEHHPSNGLNKIILDEIEPFTIILYEYGKLLQFIWDGTNKHFANLDSGTAHIWSSVTLYSQEAVQKRQRWFDLWMNNHRQPSPANIMDFHLETGDGDPVNDLVMKRGNGLFTNSISLVRLSNTEAVFKYLDLRNGTESDTSIPYSRNIFASHEPV